MKIIPDGLRGGGAIERSPPETGKETTGEKIVDPGANMAVEIFLAISGKLLDKF